MRYNWYRCEKCGSSNTELHTITEYGVKSLILVCLDCGENRVVQKEYLEEDDEEYND